MLESADRSPSPPESTPRRLAPWLGLGAASALAAAVWADPTFTLRGLAAYGAVAALNMAALAWVFRRRATEPIPRGVATAAAVAFAVRLAVALGLQRALPAYSYPVEYFRSGYIFQDAWVRDESAWEWASSGEGLGPVLAQGVQGDQYGGLWVLSGLAYRSLSPDMHRPILIVFFSAGASALAVAFGWAFSARAFGPAAARISAWVLSLFPEAVLLGGSQMREPFLIAALALAIWGVSDLGSEARLGAWARVVAGCAVAIVFSPPFAVVILAIVISVGMARGLSRVSLPRRILWPLGALAVLGLFLTLRAWSNLRFAPEGNPLAVFGWWLSVDVPYQLSEFARLSGWADRVFSLTPEWMHMPLATGYGLVQPFLPAALADNTGAWIMSLIVGLRAAGWLVVLILLVYATGAALKRRLPFVLAVWAWLGAILASYRAMGDQWDNPRYRTIFLVLYAALAGWAWVRAASQRSPWLARTATIILAFHAVFLQWYLGRYYHTPRFSFEITLGLSLATVVILVLVFLAYDRVQANRAGRLTGSRPAV